MAVIMYMAMSANGMIAKSDDDTSWISKAEWDSYSSIVRQTGNVIVGRRTYNILTKQPEFAEFKDVKVVVVSHGGVDLTDPSHIVVDSPEKAIEALKGFETVVVAGGGILNSSFLAENLVDEIYLDIEPIVFGQGLPLFNREDFDKNLKLLGTKMIADDEIQLHYQVVR